MLTHVHNPLATEGNFCDENRNDLKPQILRGHNQHMWYVDKGDRMTNSYSVQQWAWKWEKSFFFHLLIMTIVSIFLLPTSCGAERTEISNLPSCETWLKMLGVYLVPISHWWPAAIERKVTWFNVNFSNYWPFHSPVSHERYKRECDVGLRIGECFKVYHKRCKLQHIEECWQILKPQKISPSRYVKEIFMYSAMCSTEWNASELKSTNPSVWVSRRMGCYDLKAQNVGHFKLEVKASLISAYTYLLNNNNVKCKNISVIPPCIIIFYVAGYEVWCGLLSLYLTYLVAIPCCLLFGLYPSSL
jgi:hypothetical protein